MRIAGEAPQAELDERSQARIARLDDLSDVLYQLRYGHGRCGADQVPNYAVDPRGRPRAGRPRRGILVDRRTGRHQRQPLVRDIGGKERQAREPAHRLLHRRWRRERRRQGRQYLSRVTATDQIGITGLEAGIGGNKDMMTREVSSGYKRLNRGRRSSTSGSRRRTNYSRTTTTRRKSGVRGVVELGSGPLSHHGLV